MQNSKCQFNMSGFRVLSTNITTVAFKKKRVDQIGYDLLSDSTCTAGPMYLTRSPTTENNKTLLRRPRIMGQLVRFQVE